MKFPGSIFNRKELKWFPPLKKWVVYTQEQGPRHQLRHYTLIFAASLAKGLYSLRVFTTSTGQEELGWDLENQFTHLTRPVWVKIWTIKEASVGYLYLGYIDYTEEEVKAKAMRQNPAMKWATFKNAQKKTIVTVTLLSGLTTLADLHVGNAGAGV